VAKDSLSKSDLRIGAALFGSTVGAAGWIVGAALELLSAPAPPPGILLDVLVVLCCATTVLLIGLFVWRLYLAGRRLNVLFVVETLLGASLMLGTVALVWMDARGVLSLVVLSNADSGQPGNEIWQAIGRHVPPKLVYLVPLVILGLMGAVWWSPVRRRILTGQTHIQRGTPDRELSGRGRTVNSI
jgi:hypothetical protein